MYITSCSVQKHSLQLGKLRESPQQSPALWQHSSELKISPQKSSNNKPISKLSLCVIPPEITSLHPQVIQSGLKTES